MTDQLLVLLAQYDYEGGETDPLRMIGAFVVTVVICFGVPYGLLPVSYDQGFP
jgi:hypothetical protein